MKIIFHGCGSDINTTIGIPQSWFQYQYHWIELLDFGFNINTSNGILRFRLQSQYSNSSIAITISVTISKIQNVFLFLLGCCQDAMISGKYSQNSIRSIHFQDHWQSKSSLSFLLLKVFTSKGSAACKLALLIWEWP